MAAEEVYKPFWIRRRVTSLAAEGELPRTLSRVGPYPTRDAARLSLATWKDVVLTTYAGTKAVKVLPDEVVIDYLGPGEEEPDYAGYEPFRVERTVTQEET
jgi:hypothetical protein